MAINTKSKRKIVYKDKTYYWFVRIEKDGSHRIHIMTEDKRLNKAYPLVDTEVSVTPEYICKIIRDIEDDK